jgi:hypothetical protein
MALLGLILVVASVGLAVDVLFQNTAAISVDGFGQTWSISPGWLLMVGVAVGVAAIVGCALFASGVSRSRRNRAALRAYHRSAEGLQAERDRLASELERERSSARKVVKVDRPPTEVPLTADRGQS